MLQVIAEHLSLEEVEIIKDMFTLMDTDKNGRVTYEELKAGLQKVGSQLAEPEIKLLMDVVGFCKFYIIHSVIDLYNFSSLIVPRLFDNLMELVQTVIWSSVAQLFFFTHCTIS